MGDYTREDYLTRREAISKELRALTNSDDDTAQMDRLADLIQNVVTAWRPADAGQRNRLDRCIFQGLWLDGDRLISVNVRPDCEPFFRLNYESFVKGNVGLATRRGFEPPISALTGRYVRPATPPGRPQHIW